MAKTGERWTALRKEALLISIKMGEVTRAQAMEDHNISEEEMEGMESAYQKAGLAGLRVLPSTAPRACRICGCTNDNACQDPIVGACWWVELDLCSHCRATIQGKRLALRIAVSAIALLIAGVWAVAFLLTHHS